MYIVNSRAIAKNFKKDMLGGYKIESYEMFD